jgi:pyridinium-3,5-bisthiocarboxylic acid mononucleotide nickel chelatase
VAKTAYFDCFSGAAGDMVLGALLDIGLPLPELRRALGSLALNVESVTTERVLRSGVSATKFRFQESAAAHSHAQHHHHHDHDHGHTHDHVHAHGPERDRDHGRDHDHHSLKEIAAAIEQSGLSRNGKDRAIHLFRRLADAEAAIHDMPVERVHLHEVGALDSIVDIVGTVFGLEWLGASKVISSPVNVGSGVVHCEHGVFPVPAPATARLLQGAPIYSGAVASELTTPTGALIVTSYATSYGLLPLMKVRHIGYGAGDKDFKGHPNVFRLLVGETDDDVAAETIVEIQCEIDDMNPQLFGPLMDRLYEAGALDVFYAPVQMKKNRPGTLVTALAKPERRPEILGVLFSETTTIGVRYREMLRECLEREMVTIDTPVGRIRFKVARREGQILNAAPEFDDCIRAAAEARLPVKEVQALALKAWLDRKLGG